MDGQSRRIVGTNTFEKRYSSSELLNCSMYWGAIAYLCRKPTLACAKSNKLATTRGTQHSSQKRRFATVVPVQTEKFRIFRSIFWVPPRGNYAGKRWFAQRTSEQQRHALRHGALAGVQPQQALRDAVDPQQQGQRRQRFRAEQQRNLPRGWLQGHRAPLQQRRRHERRGRVQRRRHACCEALSWQQQHRRVRACHRRGAQHARQPQRSRHRLLHRTDSDQQRSTYRLDSSICGCTPEKEVKGDIPEAQSCTAQKTSTLTRMAQQHHHGHLSQHTSHGISTCWKRHDVLLPTHVQTTSNRIQCSTARYSQIDSILDLSGVFEFSYFRYNNNHHNKQQPVGM